MHRRDMECSSDVSIYWNIRQKDRKGKIFGDKEWESQKHNLSSDHARRCVRQLLNNDILKAALDPLLDVPGLRDGMRISTVHKLISAKCDEEAATYLVHIINIWSRIVRPSKESITKIVAEDVKALELRCPKFCTRDAMEIKEKIECGHIFRAFSKAEKKAMQTEIFSIDYVIPSLHTFFQDIHLLEACATSMKHILTPGSKTIRTTLRNSFRQGGQLQESAREPTADISFQNAIQALWTFVLQNFQRMPRPSERTDRRLLAKPLVEKPHEGTQFRFAKLAQQLGFQTSEIERLKQMTVRQGDGQRTDLEYQTYSQRHLTRLESTALSVLVVKNSAEALQRRCGRPKNDTYQHDRKFLTKEILHFDFSVLNVEGPEITSFFILRSQYFAFFANSRVLANYLSTSGSSNTDFKAGLPSEEYHVPKLLNLGESIMRSRKYSEESDISVISLTTGENDKATVCELALENILDTAPISGGQERGVQPNTVHVMFKAFREGRFDTLKQVNAGDPIAVKATAQALVRDEKMKLFSARLEPLMPEECFGSAMASGLNTVILLPEKEIEISAKLQKEIAQLHQR